MTAMTFDRRRNARAAFAEAGSPEAATRDELNRSVSDAGIDRDLLNRVATVRDLVPGRMVFTTSFGIEDQAIAHAIFG